MFKFPVGSSSSMGYFFEGNLENQGLWILLRERKWIFSEKKMFSFVSSSKSTFFVRVSLILLVLRLCCTRVTHAAIVSHSCCTCVAHASLMSQSCCSLCTRNARVWHSCYNLSIGSVLFLVALVYLAFFYVISLN